MATVSGLPGECQLNPRLAFRQDRRWNRDAANYGWQNSNRW
jgi:hypothetical protein